MLLYMGKSIGQFNCDKKSKTFFRYIYSILGLLCSTRISVFFSSVSPYIDYAMTSYNVICLIIMYSLQHLLSSLYWPSVRVNLQLQILAYNILSLWWNEMCIRMPMDDLTLKPLNKFVAGDF